MKTLQDTVSIEDALRMIYGCRDAATLSKRLGVTVSEVASCLPSTPSRKASTDSVPKKLYRIIFKVVTRGVQGAPKTVRITKVGISSNPTKRAETVRKHLQKLLGSDTVTVYIHTVCELDCGSRSVEQQESRLLEYLSATKCFDTTLFPGASECFCIKGKYMRRLKDLASNPSIVPDPLKANTFSKQYINALIN